MDFKQLEYFKTIYEEGSISKAAEKLYISQQGLSKALNGLEKELDCRLLERKPKGVELTEAGQIFIKGIDSLLEEKKQLLRDMMHCREHNSLTVNMVIGARFSLPAHFFQHYMERHPEVELKIHEVGNEQCFYDLERGRCDLAIVIPDGKEREGYGSRLLKREKITLVMPQIHYLAGKKRIPLASLHGQPIIYHAGSSSSVFMQKCKEQGVEFSKIIEVPGMLALYQTCAGTGIPGLSLGSLEDKMMFQNLVAVPVCEEDVTWDITLMYHESMGKVRIVNEFIEYLTGGTTI